MKNFLLFSVEHLKTIDTFEPEYDFFIYLANVATKEDAEKFLKNWRETFEEQVYGMTTIKDGKSEKIYIGEPIPKRTIIHDDHSHTFECQTFENYPEEKAAYLEIEVA